MTPRFRLDPASSPACLRRCAGMLLAATCTACGHTPATTYLSLPSAPGASASSSHLPASVAPVRVLAVRLPAWLDRQEVARRLDGGEVKVEELQRWAAPIDDLALETLTHDLSERLSPVEVLPPISDVPPSTRDVSVTLSYMAQQGATLTLSGTATVTDSRTGALLRVVPLRASVAAPADGAGEALALGDLLGTVADRLAAALAL